jgi:hypothetical protein
MAMKAPAAIEAKRTGMSACARTLVLLFSRGSFMVSASSLQGSKTNLRTVGALC